MRKGIIKRTFIITIILFLAFFIFQNIFHNVLFMDIYLNSIKKYFQNDFSNFINNYNSTLNINTYISEFEKKQNAPMLIYSESNKIINENFFKKFNAIQIESEGKKIYVIMDEILESNKIMLYDFQSYDSIKIDAIQIGNSLYYQPVYIAANQKLYTNNYFMNYLKDNVNLLKNVVTINGKIRNRQISIKYNDQQKKLNMLLCFNYILLFHSSHLTKEAINKHMLSFWEDDYYLLSNSKKIDNVVINFLSIKKINNANINFSFVNSYYIIMYGIFLLIIFFLFLFYTRWLSNPINQLNNIAKKIATLDFSDNISIRTGDEFEELSNSMQSISNNLKNTIENLNKKNNQLSIESAKRQESEKRVRYILTTMAHEFRTPLILILTSKNIIQDNLFDKEPLYYYNIIEDEVLKLNKLIDESIEISKMESGYFTYNPTNFEITSVIDSVLDLFHEKIKEKNLYISRMLNKYVVYADTEKIQQVLTNFISNAIKYTPNKGKIHIKTENYDNDNMIVKVLNTLESDLTNEQINLLWNKYFRINKNNKKASKGFGLGLEICSNILELHNSEYGSQKNNDMIEFYFTLPLSK